MLSEQYPPQMMTQTSDIPQVEIQLLKKKNIITVTTFMSLDGYFGFVVILS